MAVAVKWDLKANAAYNESMQGVRNMRTAWVSGLVAAATDKLSAAVAACGVNLGDFHPSPDQAAIGMVCVDRVPIDVQRSGTDSIMVSVAYETTADPILDDGTTPQPWVVSCDGQLRPEPYSLSANKLDKNGMYAGAGETLIVRYRRPGMSDAQWTAATQFKVGGKYNPLFAEYNQAALFEKQIGLTMYTLRRRFSAKLGAKFGVQNWPAFYQTHLNVAHGGWKANTLMVGPISVYSVDRGYRSMNVQVTLLFDPRGHDPFIAFGLKNGTMPPLSKTSYVDTNGNDLRDPAHSNIEGDQPYGILRPHAYDMNGTGIDLWDPQLMDIGNCTPIFFN